MAVKSVLGVRTMDSHEKYLGVKILQHGSSCTSYNYLIEEIDNRLPGWKRHNLTHAGRDTMIQSVLALIPVYYMAMSLLPKSVIKRMNHILRNFWWEHSSEHMKMHFLKWDWFLTSKAKGGLGLRYLEDLNKALVEKLAWRFLQHPDSLWSRILHAQYLRDISL